MTRCFGTILSILLLAFLWSATSVTSASAGQSAREGTLQVVIPTGFPSVQRNAATAKVTVPGFGRLLVPGKPNLPAKIFSIALPPGTEVVEATFEAVGVKTLPGTFQVPPAPLPRVVGVEDPAVLARHQKVFQANHDAVYGKDAPYPASPGEVVCTGGFRRYNFVDVRITPVSWRPLSGALSACTGVLVRIRYQTSTHPPRAAELAPMSKRLETKARQLLFNYDQARAWYPSGRGARGLYDYVIITLDSLTDAVQTLANCREPLELYLQRVAEASAVGLVRSLVSTPQT